MEQLKEQYNIADFREVFMDYIISTGQFPLNSGKPTKEFKKWMKSTFGDSLIEFEVEAVRLVKQLCASSGSQPSEIVSYYFVAIDMASTQTTLLMSIFWKWYKVDKLEAESFSTEEVREAYAEYTRLKSKE